MKVKRKVKPLEEKEAVELGAQLGAEFVLMAAASGIAYNEVRKYKLREAEKDELIFGFIEEETERLAELKKRAHDDLDALGYVEKRLKTLLDEVKADKRLHLSA